MGKAGRVACIATPMILTICSFVTMVFVEIGGWNSGSSILNGMYFMSADFSNLTTTPSGSGGTDELTAALTAASASNALKAVYQIHLWNYCTANDTSDGINWCSDRQSGFVFDPVEAWGLNVTTIASEANGTTTGIGAIDSAINNVEDNVDDFEERVLGSTASGALNAYKNVAKWNFYAFEIAFWTTLATIAVGLLAIFSRWGSLFTWIFSTVSTVLTFAASLTTTILYSTLTGALSTLLKPYGISVKLGTHALAVAWIATAFSVAATLFWLMSICCCSGRSNPHHKSNKGGLWNAEPKGQGYGDHNGRGRGLRVEKTGGGYQRVSSPFMGEGGHEDRVPLADYPQPQGYGQHMQPGGAYEPFRHERH